MNTKDRKCSICKVWLPLTKENFQYRTRYNFEGEPKGIYSYQCRPCRNAIARERESKKVKTPTGVKHGIQKPHVFSGWTDPADRLFFCQVPPTDVRR